MVDGWGVVVVGQPITHPISGSSLDFSLTCPGVNQDVREDPELDRNTPSQGITGLARKIKIKLDWGSKRSSSRDGLSTPYRLTEEYCGTGMLAFG